MSLPCWHVLRLIASSPDSAVGLTLLSEAPRPHNPTCWGISPVLAAPSSPLCPSRADRAPRAAVPAVPQGVWAPHIPLLQDGCQGDFNHLYLHIKSLWKIENISICKVFLENNQMLHVDMNKSVLLRLWTRTSGFSGLRVLEQWVSLVCINTPGLEQRGRTAF